MNSKRKIAFLIIVLVVVSAMFVFGAGSQEEAEGTTTLDYWAVKEAEVTENSIKEVIGIFEERNPNISINFNFIPYPQYRDKILVAMSGGNAPDVYLVDCIWNSEFAAAGYLTALDEYISESSIVAEENYFPGAWESCVWQGKTYGIPSDADVWGYTFYNKDMFADAGLDAENPDIYTWEGFLNSSEKITNPDAEEWAIGLPGAKGEAASLIMDIFVYSNGGSIVSPDGKKSTVNSPEAEEALNYLLELEEYAPTGVAAAEREDNLLLFKNQKVSMFWFPQLAQDNLINVDFEWDFGPTPAPEGKDPVGMLGGWNAVISVDTPYSEEAFSYIEHMTSAEFNHRVTPLVSANIEAAEKLMERKRNKELVISYLEDSIPRPVSPVYAQVSEVQQDLMQAIFTGAPVDEALEVADREIQKVLDSFYK